MKWANFYFLHLNISKITIGMDNARKIKIATIFDLNLTFTENTDTGTCKLTKMNASHTLSSKTGAQYVDSIKNW